MTKAEHVQITKAKEIVDSLWKKKQKEQIDLYYRYQGKTFIKTLSDRQARKVIMKVWNKGKEDINTDIEPLLFDCVSCGCDPIEPMIPSVNEDLFRSILRSVMFSYGITESEIQAWEKELITKN